MSAELLKEGQKLLKSIDKGASGDRGMTYSNYFIYILYIFFFFLLLMLEPSSYSHVLY